MFACEVGWVWGGGGGSGDKWIDAFVIKFFAIAALLC